MTTILGAAASALSHYERVMDVTAHNLANVNTAGFKRSRAMSEGAPATGVAAGQGRLGVGQTSIDLIVRTGPALLSENHLSFAIQDDAFMRVTGFDGTVLFTRFGQLDVDSARNVVDFRGRFLLPPIHIPEGTTNPSVDASGNVVVIDSAGKSVVAGRLSVARFVNPQGLEALGDGVYRESLNSGAIQVGEAGDTNFAPFIPMALEGSNVEISEEFTTMILAQRAYQASARTFKIGDEMLEASTNLTR